MNSSDRLRRYGDPRLLGVMRQVLPAMILDVTTPELHPIRFLAHEKIRTKVQIAMEGACDVTKWAPVEIQGYNVRPIRGGKSWSLHSWALAWDVFGLSGPIDPVTGRHRPPNAWFHHMESRGFEWGGRWRKADPHHVQWSD